MTTETYEFFPDDVRDQLPALYAQDGVADKTAHVKFFAPWSNWTWYAVEGSPEEDDFIFFGYVIGQENEWCYFSLSDLESGRGPFGLRIERDIHFRPCMTSALPAAHRPEPGE